MAKGINGKHKRSKRMRNLNKNRRIYKGHSLVQDVGDYTVVDIETTSLDSFHGEILEISAIKVRNKKEVDNFSELIRTNEEIGYFTTNLTGITNEMRLKEGKELEEVLQSFKIFLGNDIIVGHNVNFDINFLYDNMEEHLDTYIVTICYSLLVSKMNMIFSIFLFIILMALCLVQEKVMILIDLKKPKITWTSEYAMMKENVNVMYEFFYAVVVVILLTVIAFIINNIAIFMITIFLTLVCINLAINQYVKKNQMKLYRKIF